MSGDAPLQGTSPKSWIREAIEFVEMLEHTPWYFEGLQEWATRARAFEAKLEAIQKKGGW
jgi:hypothetical protein